MNPRPLRSTLLAAAALFALGPIAIAQEPNPIPQTFRSIYPQPSDAQSQVNQAMTLAAQQNKRVILDFGTNQCADCQVLEILLHKQPNQTQIAEHFLLVHIDVGPKHNQNLDLARRYNIPVQNGVPALAVIDGEGHLIHAQSHGEFTHARNMSTSDVTHFLNKWRTS